MFSNVLVSIMGYIKHTHTHTQSVCLRSSVSVITSLRPIQRKSAGMWNWKQTVISDSEASPSAGVSLSVWSPQIVLRSYPDIQYSSCSLNPYLIDNSYIIRRSQKAAAAAALACCADTERKPYRRRQGRDGALPQNCNFSSVTEDRLFSNYVFTYWKYSNVTADVPKLFSWKGQNESKISFCYCFVLLRFKMVLWSKVPLTDHKVRLWKMIRNPNALLPHKNKRAKTFIYIIYLKNYKQNVSLETCGGPTLVLRPLFGWPWCTQTVKYEYKNPFAPVQTHKMCKTKASFNNLDV